MAVLFRPSRPDFIETSPVLTAASFQEVNCSGLPGRTTLRWFADGDLAGTGSHGLFRSSRPDFIETGRRFVSFQETFFLIVPAFWVGLH